MKKQNDSNSLRLKIYDLRLKSKKGFTVAEMIMVTLIIAVLTSIGFQTYYKERDRFQFNNALTKMIGIIKTARNLATTSAPVYIPTSGSNIVPSNGYGIYINLNPTADNPHFTLFASIGDDDSDPDTFNVNYDKGLTADPDITIETYRLPDKIVFRSFDFGGKEQWSNVTDPPGPSKTEAVIIFRPPLADAYIGDNSSTPMNKLSMNLFNPFAKPTSQKRCQFIRFNAIKTFPELEYSDCN